MKKKVSIVMATYNGDKYIRKQLDSILNNNKFEDYVEEFIITDDNSSDDTFSIIEEYEKNNKKIKSFRNTKKGVKNNFLNGISKTRGDYIMLSDQDDIWHENKIERMFNKIESLNVDNNEKPILVFSDSRVIDNQLNVIEHSFFSYYDINPKKHRLDDLFIRNVCQGCVTIFNKELIPFIKADSIDNWYMHDWWFIMTASLYGTVDFIDEPLIDYRIHDGNVAGGLRKNIFKKIKSSRENMERYKNETNKICKQSIAFMREHRLDRSRFRAVDIISGENTTLRKLMAIFYYFNFSTFIKNNQ
ncbi:glycosyl transferase [Raoultella planticola]|nr:glycosyl transferase [Raoultella planticola]